MVGVVGGDRKAAGDRKFKTKTFFTAVDAEGGATEKFKSFVGVRFKVEGNPKPWTQTQPLVG